MLRNLQRSVDSLISDRSPSIVHHIAHHILGLQQIGRLTRRPTGRPTWKPTLLITLSLIALGGCSASSSHGGEQVDNTEQVQDSGDDQGPNETDELKEDSAPDLDRSEDANLNSDGEGSPENTTIGSTSPSSSSLQATAGETNSGDSEAETPLKPLDDDHLADLSPQVSEAKIKLSSWTCERLNTIITSFGTQHFAVRRGYINPLGVEFAYEVLDAQIEYLDPTRIIFSSEDYAELKDHLTEAWNSTRSTALESPGVVAAGESTESLGILNNYCDYSEKFWSIYVKRLQSVIKNYQELSSLFNHNFSDSYLSLEEQEEILNKLADTYGITSQNLQAVETLLRPIQGPLAEDQLAEHILRLALSELALSDLQESNPPITPGDLFEGKRRLNIARLSWANDESIGFAITSAAFLKSLDPVGDYLSYLDMDNIHSFHTPSTWDSTITRVRGQWGIGHHGLITVRSTDFDELLKPTGLRPGDVIISLLPDKAIKPFPAAGLTLLEFINLISAPEPSSITFQILRQSQPPQGSGYEVLSLDVPTEHIAARRIAAQTLDTPERPLYASHELVSAGPAIERSQNAAEVLHLKVHDYYFEASPEARSLSDIDSTVKDAWNALNSEGYFSTSDHQELYERAVVLDLRGSNNTKVGHLFEAAIISSLFLKPLPSPSYQGLVNLDENPVLVGPSEYHSEQYLWQGAVVILIDQFTSYTSEIIATLLKDTGRALIVGSKTDGHGLIHAYDSYSDAENSFFPGIYKHTVAEVFSFSGKSIQGTGVQPNIPLETLSKRYKSSVDSQFTSQPKYPSDHTIPSTPWSSKTPVDYLPDDLVDWLVKRSSERHEAAISYLVNDDVTDEHSQESGDTSELNPDKIISIQGQEDDQIQGEDIILKETLQITRDYLDYLRHLNAFEGIDLGGDLKASGPGGPETTDTSSGAFVDGSASPDKQ